MLFILGFKSANNSRMYSICFKGFKHLRDLTAMYFQAQLKILAHHQNNLMLVSLCSVFCFVKLR